MTAKLWPGYWSVSAEIDPYDDSDRTPLVIAALCGNVKTVVTLVTNGAGVNGRKCGKASPLHAAAEKGRLSAVRLLVDNGADVSAKLSGQAISSYARKHPEILQLLIPLEAAAEARASAHDANELSEVPEGIIRESNITQ